MFNATEFMAECEAHGLATRAYRVTPGDAGFVVGFLTPDEPIFDGAAQTARIEIEYTTADVTPALSKGDRLTIASQGYRVADAPRRGGDGTFTRVALELVRA
jgi:hypothetical protein